jgi:formylglycine-generating enzyme required for sulfatase activity
VHGGDGPKRPNRVVRGGSWNDHAQNVRAAYRNANHREDRNDNVGFRVARARAWAGGPGPDQVVIPSALLGRRKGSGGPARAYFGRARRPFLLDARWVVMNEDRPNPLEDGAPPEWASSWGEDRQGVWVAFEVGGVEQILRWIPPGTFMMGSPKGEPGRFEDEGPQHEVTISRGLWLGDTPCTQALWTAVMGANPSRFQDPRRPVEQVNVGEVEAFLEKVEALIPGLGLRLPTEAEWEYACRAGTTEATYGGPIQILGENNAPVLDPIAWYGGNSGQEYELADGYDSSKWPNKQYPHRKAGTHPVKLRQRNPWGLYDMLGNVLEWCMDGWESDAYAHGLPIDPYVPGHERPLRVVRGGSWDAHAQSVRAAFRFAGHREVRGGDVGFRVARGQAPEGQQASTGGAGKARRVREARDEPA